MNMLSVFSGVVIVCFVLITQSASAQHADIWLVLNGNQTTLSDTDLATSNPVLIDATTGKYLFIGDFFDPDGGPFETDDPGYQSLGVFAADARLFYRAVGSLQFWNGTFWVDTVPDGERVQIDDNAFPGVITTIDVNGVTEPEGFIDRALSTGSVHRHVDYIIDNTGTDLPATGAYMIELQLFFLDDQDAIVHTESEPFKLVFNFRLSSEEFDEAVEALTSPPVNVPFPGYALVFMAGLFLLITRRITCQNKP